MSTLSVAWPNALTRKGANTSSIRGIDAVHTHIKYMPHQEKSLECQISVFHGSGMRYFNFKLKEVFPLKPFKFEEELEVV